MKTASRLAVTSLAAMTVLVTVPPLLARQQAPAGPTVPAMTVLYDNYVADGRCAADWGFAALIEGFGPTILFDTGTKADLLQKNVEALGVDLAKVDLAVISHDHGDHIGGLSVLFRQNPGVPLHVPHLASSQFQSALRDRGVRMVAVKEPSTLAPGVMSTGDLGDAIHEQALILDTPRGLVVITGCAHPGIVAILERARAVGKKNIWMVLGGFHLVQTAPDAVERIIARFKELGVQRVGATHCTGDAAIQAFRKAYAQDFVGLGSGQRVALGAK